MRGSKDMYMFDLFQPVDQPIRKPFLVVSYLFHADFLEIFSSNAKTRIHGYIGGASSSSWKPSAVLKPVAVTVSTIPPPNIEGSRTGSFIRSSCPGRPEHLVTRKGKKATTPTGNLTRQVGS